MGVIPATARRSHSPPQPALDVAVVGGANSDYTAWGPRLPRPEGAVQGSEFIQALGGKGLNQAVAAARLGARAGLVACVGTDRRGSVLIAYLAGEQVEVRHVLREAETKTGATVIQVDRYGRKQQRPLIERSHQQRRPRADEVTVLAGGTSLEELIEGLSIGVGVAIRPGLGVLVALAILIDNLSEALSIGVLVRSEGQGDRRAQVRRVLGWTGLIGASLLGSALAGWLFLRGLSPRLLGFLLAVGAGGMFYLTVSHLVPEAEERHYQQSAAVAMAAGFLTIFAVSSLI